MAQRTDWPAASLATMLAEAGPDAISEPLVRAARIAEGPQAPRFVRLLELVHVDAASPVIRAILETSDDAEAVTACLRVVQDPALLELVRDRTTDERWQIRLQAVRALGRMGSRSDEWYLVRALEDANWWVRYRAARALAELPAMDAQRLHRLSNTVEDRYGRDMLRQVIAEQEIAC
jgi:HEAT repeat protein